MTPTGDSCALLFNVKHVTGLFVNASGVREELERGVGIFTVFGNVEAFEFDLGRDAVHAIRKTPPAVWATIP